MKNGKIGIDVGALFTKAVRLDENNNILEFYYEKHKGNIKESIEELFGKFKCTEADTIGLTGSAAERVQRILDTPILDITACQVKTINNHYKGISDIIDIGGGSATIIQLDKEGKFQGYATNSLCAAGTGSFLDEQASRLSISFHEMEGFNHILDPPTIATRCSVFAKSDLIHRQQEGCSKEAMWSGLCRGMTRTLLGTLLNGRPLSGKTIIIGGVAQNQEVLRWMEDTYPEHIVVPENPHLVTAVGAALLGAPPKKPISMINFEKSDQKKEARLFPWNLTIDKSEYPSFAVNENYKDENQNEIRIMSFPKNESISGYLGIDIGSTSTKLAFINENEEVVADIYRKTAGDPIGACKLILRALNKLQSDKNTDLNILGVGTTGSGRKIVGEVIGADAIINEISAHVAGAVKTDPTIDTIFEIGGQDSKYMHVVDGHIRDSNMNYVCAAGTGSFVEEIAAKLGYPVSDVGQKILGKRPPRATDRCTVFMEQDVAKLIQAGQTPEDALAAVMVSVTKNYLNKVVGNRYRNQEKIFFQGATARNPALVAAFEHLLDVKMIVSPYCHVMGCFGVALLVKKYITENKIQKSKFRGFGLEELKINLRKEVCDLCQNDCAITFADIEGSVESPSWGYMCGRDPEETKMKVNPHERYFKKRRQFWRQAGSGAKIPANAPVVGIPQTLTTYTYLPLWQRFFNELGFQIQLSPKTNDKIREKGVGISGADFCFPAKVAVGHVASLFLTEGVDYVFLPQMANEAPKEEVTSAVFCPYVQGLPAYSKSTLELNGIDTARILSPIYDRRLSEGKLLARITKVLAGPLGSSAGEIRRAWIAGQKAQEKFTSLCQEAGKKALTEARENGEKLLVLVGRPYNSFDEGMNLGLPRKIAERGKTLLPMEFLDIDLGSLGERYENIYWGYGQKIIAALERVASDDGLDAVYFTNFNCGPDSFLLTYAEEIMGNQPFLALELDEHGADAGYLTRIEAFLDVLSKPRSKPVARAKYQNEVQEQELKKRIIWIPPMHEYGTPFMASAFKLHGYNAKELPAEEQDTYDLGRSVTRGSECLPTALTIGVMLSTLDAYPKNGHKHALFMPTAQGPCRFGQYCTLHRQILDREGHEDVFILSPSSTNSYFGLDEMLRRTIFKSFVAADILLKARCKVRPYEVNPGETNDVVNEQVKNVSRAIENGQDLVKVLKNGIREISAIRTEPGEKPLVGVVGEIYIRNSRFGNENLIDAIEEFGGEVWMAPIAEWILYTASPLSYLQYMKSAFSKKAFKNYISFRWQRHWEHKLYNACRPFISDRIEPAIKKVFNGGQKYMTMNIGGEALSIIGRTLEFSRQGASLVVNCAPFGCMPGTVTTALFRNISREIGMPIVNLFYDGNGNENKRLKVFLNNAIS